MGAVVYEPMSLKEENWAEADAKNALRAGASAQLSRQYKDATDIVVERKPCRYIVRRLTPTECARLQGFPDWWCDGIAVPNPTDEDIAFWTDVWETHRKAMNPEGKPKTRKQITTWLRDPGSDSNEYKMWGNGMALPCMIAVLNGVNSIMQKSNLIGQSNISIQDRRINPKDNTIMAVDCYNQSVSDVAMTLSSSACDYDHVPCVVYETNRVNV